MKWGGGLFAGILFVWVSAASGTGISTNGGIPATEQNNVWFLGDEPIEYCISATGSFRLSPEERRNLVRETIGDWVTFFRKHGLDKMYFPDLDEGRSLKLALNFREVASCTEGRLDQLHFEFGAPTPMIRQALDSQSEAFALAIRDEYNHETYRNGGTIWVRDWPFSRPQLKHLLLHELGHVFGMEHDSVHVMDSRIADLIRVENNATEFGVIESSIWPYRINTGDVLDFSRNGRLYHEYEPNFLLTLFRDIIGFKKSNHHSLKLDFTESRETLPAWEASLNFLEFETGKSVEMKGRLYVSPYARNDVRGIQGPVLHTQWYCAGCTDGGISFRRYLDPRPSGVESSGSFTYDGVIYPAILERRKGMLLRIFVAPRGVWWTSQDYSSSATVLK